MYINYHQSPIINHQQSIITHQPSIISQSSIINQARLRVQELRKIRINILEVSRTRTTILIIMVGWVVGPYLATDGTDMTKHGPSNSHQIPWKYTNLTPQNFGNPFFPSGLCMLVWYGINVINMHILDMYFYLSSIINQSFPSGNHQVSQPQTACNSQQARANSQQQAANIPQPPDRSQHPSSLHLWASPYQEERDIMLQMVIFFGFAWCKKKASLTLTQLGQG